MAELKFPIHCPCCLSDTEIVSHCYGKKCPAKWLRCKMCNAVISMFGLNGEQLPKPRHSSQKHTKNCLDKDGIPNA